MKNPLGAYIIGIVCAYFASKILFNDSTISSLFLIVFLLVWGFISGRHMAAYKAEQEDRDNK